VREERLIAEMGFGTRIAVCGVFVYVILVEYVTPI
jgi:hypothetical protein